MHLLNFKSNIILENDRVQLRPLGISDFDQLRHFSKEEPTLWQYSLISAAGEDQMMRYLEFAMSQKQKEDSYPFIVFDKRTKKYAGSTRFYDYRKAHNTVQLGYTWYGSEFWGTGLNQNCKYLMLSYAFDTLGIHRVEFRADNNNKRSIAAMKKLGCTLEGILRSNCAAGNGARRDSIVLSILKEEWDSTIKKALAENIHATTNK